MRIINNWRQTMLTTLYKVGANSNMLIWEVRQLPKAGELSIMYGVRHGAMQYQTVKVNTNQSGRSLAEQVCLEADSRVNKQIDKGYCYSMEEARNSIGQNASKLPRPMLAQKLRDVTVDINKCVIQRKYNGHRCLVACTEEGLIAYSRNGKPIMTIDHILDNLDIPIGTILDGELYIHDKPLQNLGSLIRKVQPGNSDLDYIVYDTLSTKTYDRRLDDLCGMNLHGQTKVAPTKFGSNVDIREELQESIDQGYEGLILRTLDRGYEPGKRSKSLIKVKQHMDQEFLVVDVHESKDGWAILECEVYDGLTFRVSAPGTIEDKAYVLMHSTDYIGNFVNVEFFEWTNDGKPFHPVAIYFRSEE